MVGNFGSQQHFDYSLLGDPVNLASRLEGLGKVYGIDLVIGEETARRLDEPALIEVDLVAVKGKSQAGRVYTLPPERIEARSLATGIPICCAPTAIRIGRQRSVCWRTAGLLQRGIWRRSMNSTGAESRISKSTRHPRIGTASLLQKRNKQPAVAKADRRFGVD